MMTFKELKKGGLYAVGVPGYLDMETTERLRETLATKFPEVRFLLHHESEVSIDRLSWFTRIREFFLCRKTITYNIDARGAKSAAEVDKHMEQSIRKSLSLAEKPLAMTYNEAITYLQSNQFPDSLDELNRLKVCRAAWRKDSPLKYVYYSMRWEGAVDPYPLILHNPSISQGDDQPYVPTAEDLAATDWGRLAYVLTVLPDTPHS